MQQKVIISKQKSKQSGFALIEIIVAIIIIGIMATLGIPRLYRAGTSPLERFTAQLNMLAQDGLQRAIAQQMPYKIVFNFKQNNRSVELVLAGKEEKVVNRIVLPTSIMLQDLIINGKTEMGRDEAWFFISPTGFAQEFILNITDPKTSATGNYGLVLNPFSVQFTLYDSFQKPVS
jgi:prepilin-type N-terminal cleavage/methylation domain-containing protein